MKKKFKIVAAGYGGEYAICTKDADFVNKSEKRKPRRLRQLAHESPRENPGK